ncbi:GTP 3',8-cyclase MoaA [Fonticella tunisiensis]|uniref:GTP 3',8-cyclase n=1 Tax=Fonticella tunisiensis TaxID=1096341 RepID=A0A4R7KAZ5_9CLOT|nr:GTP 3',8-cyclase MoaA [Fonticella tunisiensis]TDT52054.1 cyclic pyranopterin monophosphate synthase subunit MoaA [Fonticella tunisiensis]
MLDSFGRNIDYLRVSLTDRCNLRCIYCMPEEGVRKVHHDDILRFEDILKIVKAFSTLGIKKIRYTGGEPLILKGIEGLIYETSKIPGIEDITITTNGILLSDTTKELKRAGLKRVNISLDTLREDRYRKITRGGDIGRVFEAIESCIRIGLSPVKLNTVVIKGINDDEIEDFINLTKEIPVEVRFIELMPIGEGRRYFKEGHIPSEEILKCFPELIPLQADIRGTASLYKLKNSKGTVGFISPLSCKFCNTCNRIRLTASGTIKPCLHSMDEINIKNHIHNEIGLLANIKKSIFNKPGEHHLEREGISRSLKDMYQIGG